jgi:ribosomal protein S18 acetylase RimI-like enzyme
MRYALCVQGRSILVSDLVIREAAPDDLPRIIELTAQLLDDPGEDYAATPDAYDRAFAAIMDDARQTLFVAERDGAVIGSLVLVIVPNLGRHGRPYAILENIVVDEGQRSGGVGEAMVRHAIALAEQAGCYKVALTSRTHREHAHRFYERMGFRVGSVGFRIDLPAQ